MTRITDEQVDALAARFQTAGELHAENPKMPPPVCGPYLRVGDKAMLAGPPKAGKSTWLTELVRRIAAGEGELCGHELRTGPVVVLTEERAVQAAFKFKDAEGVHILTRDRELPKPSWPLLVRAAVRKCEQVGAVLLVVDTLREWSDLRGDQSNSDGAVMEVMHELTVPAALDLTVLVVHHQRKGGGRDGEGVSGNNALVGAVDVLLELEHAPEGSASTTRQLIVTSRWPGVPSVTLFDGVGEDLRILGTAEGREAARKSAWRDRVLAALPPEGEEPVSREQIEDEVQADNRKWQTALTELVTEGLVTRTGKGRKGSPYRFALAAPDAEMLPLPDEGQKGAERAETVGSLSAFPPTGGKKENRTEAPFDPGGQKGAETVTGDELLALALADPDLREIA